MKQEASDFKNLNIQKASAYSLIYSPQKREHALVPLYFTAIHEDGTTHSNSEFFRADSAGRKEYAQE